MFAGFVFDMEGTLVGSVPQNLRSLHEVLEISGYRIPIQARHLYSGLDGDQTLRLAIPEMSEDEICCAKAREAHLSTNPALRPDDAAYRSTCSLKDAFRSERERATSGMRITMVSGCELVMLHCMLVFVTSAKGQHAGNRLLRHPGRSGTTGFT
jgi:beta-phosphoglucomutase-like phosphatase (HAD superfamily)